MSLHTVIWHNLNYCFIFTIVSLIVKLLCVYMYYTNVFIPYLNVWQAMMFCAMCLSELIKKCLILSYQTDREWRYGGGREAEREDEDHPANV